MNKSKHSIRRSFDAPLASGKTCRLLGIAGLLASPVWACPPRLYTTTAHWNAGIRVNTIGVNDADDGRLQLVDPGSITTFPHLWPANAGEDTVTKFDSTANKEVGRYRTWFDLNRFPNEFEGPAPSRTAVDGNGDVYVVNRHFDNKRISVMKILTSNTGAVDRDGNGVIDTSVDTNNNGRVNEADGEVLPVNDDGGLSAGSLGGISGDGVPQIQEFHDERVKWFVRIPDPGSTNGLGRACAIDPGGNIWVGAYNSNNYWKLSSVDGSILAGPVLIPNLNGPYGAVVDSRGMLWSASISNRVGQINTNTNSFVAVHSGGTTNYGIAVDDSRNRIYMGSYFGGNPYTMLSGINTPPPTFSNPASGTEGWGISIASGGDILVHGSNSTFPNFTPGGSSGFRVGATRFRPDHSVVWSSAAQLGANDFGTRGIAPDANGDVFTINLETNNVSKYRGTSGAHLGVFPIGARPYSYSDLSGSSFQQTNPNGTWKSEHADVLRGNKNVVLSWDESGPGTVLVQVAGSNTSGAPGPFVTASSGMEVPGVAGKYITILITLQAASQVSPSVQRLLLETCPQFGDFNDDCCVDRTDYDMMRAAYNARSTDPKWDINGDGVFNVNDLRREVLLFCFPNGAPCSPGDA